jgi:hypothetical protein
MKNMALHILDIVQNSIRAKAGLIGIAIDEQGCGTALIRISDNGEGMTREMVSIVTDPFVTTRTTRRVGMGIPLFMQSAEQTGGSLSIDSAPGAGTQLMATFHTAHPDMIPWGDLPGVIILLVAANPTTEFVYLHRSPKGDYTLDTREVKAMLDGIPVNEPEVRKFLRDMMEENLSAIGAAGVLQMTTTEQNQ